MRARTNLVFNTETQNKYLKLRYFLNILEILSLNNNKPCARLSTVFQLIFIVTVYDTNCFDFAILEFINNENKIMSISNSYAIFIQVCAYKVLEK